MDLSFLTQNWWVSVIALPAVIGIIAKIVKNKDLCKAADKFDWIGVALSKFGTLRLGEPNWTKFEEGVLVTLLDAGIAAIKAIKRGMLKDNINVAVKKNLQNSPVTRTFKNALRELTEKK